MEVFVDTGSPSLKYLHWEMEKEAACPKLGSKEKKL